MCVTLVWLVYVFLPSPFSGRAHQFQSTPIQVPRTTSGEQQAHQSSRVASEPHPRKDRLAACVFGGADSSVEQESEAFVLDEAITLGPQKQMYALSG